MTWKFRRLRQRFQRPRRRKRARPKRWNGTCKILSVGPSRAKLEFDETLNRVAGRVVDETTGETIHEIPPGQLKALYTKMREQLGPLVDGTA